MEPFTQLERGSIGKNPQNYKNTCKLTYTVSEYHSQDYCIQNGTKCSFNLVEHH